MKIRPTLCLALSIAAVPAFVFFAVRGSGAVQKPSAGQPAASVKARTHEVRLPVIVLDKHNALAANLTAKDFTLTEDGRPQTIQSFAAQSDRPYTLGLLFDTSRSVYPVIDSARKAADSFIDAMLPAIPTAGAQSSTACVIHFDREVEELEDFTNSRVKLQHDLNQMTPTAQEPGSDDSASSGKYGNPGARSDAQLFDAIYLASDNLMMPRHGRKALIVFSDGADHGSKETLNDAIDAADRAGVQIFTIYFKGAEERPMNAPGGGHHGGMGGGWPGGGGGWPGSGGGWPGSGGGNRGGAPRSESGVNGRKIMQQIAGRTGGQYFEAKNKAGLDAIYSNIALLLRQQYLLAYTPDKADSQGDFHKIVLTADKKGLTVYTREGYYAPSE